MSVTSTPQRGGLVSEHRRGRLTLLLGLGAVLIGPPLSVGGLDQQVRVGGAVSTVVGFMLICGGLCMRRHVLRVYERGIEDKNRFIAFDDVHMVQANLVTYITGMGTGTDYDLVFEGQDAAGPFRIAFRSGNLGSKFKRAEDLIKAAGEPVHCRMKECLEEMGEVAWVNGLVLRSSSIYVEASGMDIPYLELKKVHLDNGYLRIRAANGYKKRMMANTKNFYPGYWLLLEQVKRSQGGKS